MSEIIIRHSEPGDVQAVRAIYAESEAYSNTLQLPFPPSVLWEQRLTQPAPGFYALVAERDADLVGQLTLLVNQRPRRRHVAEIGLGVAARARRSGVGEALLRAALDLTDHWLQVRRVEINVFVDNSAGIALYQKLGFVEEGRAREYAFRDGQFCDVLIMARLLPG